MAFSQISLPPGLLLLLTAKLGRRLPLSCDQIGANFSHRSKVIDFLRRDRRLDPLNPRHEFEHLLLELRTDRPVRRESGQNQIINLGGALSLDLHEPRQYRDRAGAILPYVKQTLESPPDNLLDQMGVGLKKIFPNDDGPCRLYEVVLFDVSDQLAQADFLCSKIKRRRQISCVNGAGL